MVTDLCQHSQYESGVGDHLFDLILVAGDDGHDVRDEVSHSADRKGWEV